MTDREQIRRDAEEIGDSPDLFRLHGFAGDVIDLLAELEQAERERDEARKSALAFEKWAEEETVARDVAEAQLAKVPALVEALRQIAADVPLMREPRDAWNIAREALAAWEKP